MNFKFLTDNFQISSRKFVAVTLLNSGTLAWFFLLAFVYLTDIFKTEFLQSVFFGFVVFCAIVGSLIGGRINRRKLLLSWISLGVFATILSAALQGTTFAVISSFLLGLSLGLGFPSSLACIAECTVVEERARVSGVIILGTFVIAFIAIAIAQILSFGILGTVLVLAIVRSISFIALPLDRFDNQEPKENEKPRLSSMAYRELIFYLLPWLMFIIAGSIAWNLIPSTSEYTTAISIATPLRYVCIAIFGLASGILADRFGRKQPIVAGLIMLGVSFALLGLIFNPLTVFIYLIISGVSWGLFFVVFLTAFGDLSFSGSREKFYGLGYILPIGILFSFALVPGSAVFSHFSPSSFSQILSIVLFLSIIPVLRAKETLSGQKIRERKMKEYVDKIGKLVHESKETNGGET